MPDFFECINTDKIKDKMARFISG